MRVIKISEYGYEEAVLGFSLSYNTSLDRVRKILPKYAFGIPGESKFLESMIIYVDVTAPRFWWQEADTYRVGTTKQSESTMHTLMKTELTQANFEYGIESDYLLYLRGIYSYYKKDKDPKRLTALKSALPEGFLQRRIWMFSYKTLQNIYIQRINHKLPQWQYFLNTLISQLDYPEFIIKEYKKE